MAAIVSNKFRITNASNFKEDLADANTSMYVYIAKSDAWSNDKTDITDDDAPFPGDYDVDERDVHDNMIAMKLLGSTNVSHVVPRNDWVNGQVYVAYDDKDADIYDKPFYVVTDEYKVYKCIVAGQGASSVKPIHTNTGLPQEEADGYSWKYMYTHQATLTDKFLTNYYMPVKTVVDDGNLTTDDQTQYDSQLAAKVANEGSIFRIVVEEGGSGYDTKPTVTISGNGTNAVVNAADITMNGTSVESINVTTPGSGYTQANVIISHANGVGAVARAVVSPAEGHGTDPVKELGAFYISTNVTLEYGEDGDFTVDNAFRQVGIIRNPLNPNSSVVATGNTLSGLKSMTLTGDFTNLNVGDFMIGADSGATAFIDSIDTDTGIVKYHQNDKTGWVPFDDTSGELVNGNNGGSGTITVASIDEGEYERYSGDVVFLENRAPINRYETQIEDIKIIIEF